MHNVKHTLDANNHKLVIEIDLSADAITSAPMSSTGKTKLVASTSGSIPLPPVEGKPVSFSVNVMVKA